MDTRNDLDNCGGCGRRCTLPQSDAYDLSCTNSGSCAIRFVNPGGVCADHCASLDTTCSYMPQENLCTCADAWSAGDCGCRCIASPVG